MIKHYCDRCGRWIPLKANSDDTPFLRYGVTRSTATKELCSSCYEELINFMKAYEAEK